MIPGTTSNFCPSAQVDLQWIGLNSYLNTYLRRCGTGQLRLNFGISWNRGALIFYQHPNARRMPLPVLEFDAALQYSHQNLHEGYPQLK
jgi:hypothetical protein